MSARSFRSFVSLVVCICAFAILSQAVAAPQNCRCSKGGFTTGALGEEFPELSLPLTTTALGEEFPELVVWMLATTLALGEEFPERAGLPGTAGLGEEFPE